MLIFLICSHSHSAEWPDDNWNLYSMLDTTQTTALNITQNDHAVAVFKPHALRLNDEPKIISDADAEIIIVARFTSPCHIRKFMVIGGDTTEHHPKQMKIFVNHEGIDFTNVANYKAAQTFDLNINEPGTMEYVVFNPNSFNNITTLTLYFTGNMSEDEDVSTVIKYIGMQGEHTHYRREPVHADYELSCTHSEVPGVGSSANAEIEHY